MISTCPVLTWLVMNKSISTWRSKFLVPTVQYISDKMGHGFDWRNQGEVSQDYRLHCSLRYRALNPGSRTCQASTLPLNCSPRRILRRGGCLMLCCKPSSYRTSVSLNLKSGIQKQNSTKMSLAVYVWFGKVNTRWQHLGRMFWNAPSGQGIGPQTPWSLGLLQLEPQLRESICKCNC